MAQSEVLLSDRKHSGALTLKEFITNTQASAWKRFLIVTPASVGLKISNFKYLNRYKI